MNAIDYRLEYNERNRMWEFQITHQDESLRVQKVHYTDSQTKIRIESCSCPDYEIGVIFIRGYSKELDDRICFIPVNSIIEERLNNLKRILHDFNMKWAQENLERRILTIDKELFKL